MGAHMARNLSRAGHEVTLWNRTAAKAGEPGLAGMARPLLDGGWGAQISRMKGLTSSSRMRRRVACSSPRGTTT